MASVPFVTPLALFSEASWSSLVPFRAGFLPHPLLLLKEKLKDNIKTDGESIFNMCFLEIYYLLSFWKLFRAALSICRHLGSEKEKYFSDNYYLIEKQGKEKASSIFISAFH